MKNMLSGGVTLLLAVLDYGAECTASALPYRTFAIRNNLTAGSYFLSRDRATDKIAQKLLSFTTFCYRHTIDSSNHTTALPSTKRWHTFGFAVLTE